MTAIGRKALELHNNGFDTSEIAQRMNLSEGLICYAIHQERQKKKENKTPCQQPQEHSE